LERGQFNDLGVLLGFDREGFASKFERHFKSDGAKGFLQQGPYSKDILFLASRLSN